VPAGVGGVRVNFTWAPGSVAFEAAGRARLARGVGAHLGGRAHPARRRLCSPQPVALSGCHRGDFRGRRGCYRQFFLHAASPVVTRVAGHRSTRARAASGPFRPAPYAPSSLQAHASAISSSTPPAAPAGDGA
jgi:hypothetical protein